MNIGRPIPVVLLSALTVTALAQRQDLPEGYPRDGETKSNDFMLGIGSGVETTYTYTREDDSSVPLFSCVRECEGKKHTKHDECDLSCDKACPSRTPLRSGHYTSFSGRVTELGPSGGDPPPRPHSERVDRDYGAFQFPSTWRADTFLLRLTNLFTRTKNYLESGFTADHWNETPCSTSTKSIKAATYIVTVQYTLFDLNGQIRTEGPKGTIRYRVLIPFRDPVTVGQPEVNCKCERTQTGTPEHGYLFQPSEGFAFIEEDDKTRPLTGRDITTLVTNVTVHDMNNATLSYSANWMGEVFIPAGWEFECEEGDGQGVQLIDDLRFMASPGRGQIHLSLAPVWSRADEKKIRVMCTQIDKPEPKPSMKYRLVPPRHALLARAAQITRVSNFRGPWDQMRLWIASDQASYDKVADTLVLTPGPESYVLAMHQLTQCGAIDPFDSRYLALMKLEHLLEPNVAHDALEWTLLVKLTANRAGTVAELKELAPNVERLVGSPRGMDQVGLIARTLVRGDAADAAVWLLGTAVPSAQRAKVAELAGDIAMSLATTTDVALATLILDWVEAHRPVSATAGLVSINPELPTPVRIRALELAKSIRPSKQLAATP